MRLFSRWRKNSKNNPVSKLEGNKRNINAAIWQRRGLFDGIVGFDDVKELFEMSIRADRPVHLLLVGPPASAEVVLQHLAFSIISLNIDRGIS
jgi:hypothetical protein